MLAKYQYSDGTLSGKFHINPVALENHGRNRCWDRAEGCWIIYVPKARRVKRPSQRITVLELKPRVAVLVLKAPRSRRSTLCPVCKGKGAVQYGRDHYIACGTCKATGRKQPAVLV